ncbi:MAG TPA: putative toxin-antitoxin system toxin component, PIN family [Terriglobales bacterium]|nr:putative toxin-antitoxin system toxin component, PIN family [Terriglobales bacterium]
MIRIVIDTNVLVSALLKTQGAEAVVLSAVVDKRALWCVSPDVLAEYGEVLRRPKFSRVPRQYIEALLALAGRAERVNPAFTVATSPHEPDNRFLECAEAAGAVYLVTGNRRHFPARHKATDIITPRQFLDAIRTQWDE